MLAVENYHNTNAFVVVDVLAAAAVVVVGQREV